MSHIQAPPKTDEIPSPSFFQKMLSAEGLNILVKHADSEYYDWDKFKHLPPPTGISIEEAWEYLKFSRRMRYEPSPIRTSDKKSFVYNLTKNMFQQLSYIDSNASGMLTSSLGSLTENQHNQLILSGLTEEAIASSQIEGANTSRKVAKEMLLKNRKPRTKDEQMIINNYLVMQQLTNWQTLSLTKTMLLDIQSLITKDTLEDPKDSGRLRTDSDEIVISNRLTGEVVFTPPKAEFVFHELDRLIEYANAEEPRDDFTHPIIKASILHFWLAYLHPFVDGNGRTARAIFYWYLLKHNYWLIKYLSISRVIKITRNQYDDAYQKTEIDDQDLTYFLHYKLKIIKQAILDFQKYYEQKIKEKKQIEAVSSKLKQYNPRQLGLLIHLKNNPNSEITIQLHMEKNQVAYQTARTDLISLEHKGLLSRVKDSKQYLFLPNIEAISKLIFK